MKNIIDDIYFQALSEANPNHVCKNAVCQYNRDNKTYSLTVWGDEFIINPADKTIKNISGNFIVHDYFALFIIYYLLNAKDIIMKNEWISEKDIPGGSTFFSGPHEIPTNRITEKFNNRLSDFQKTCEKAGGIKLKKADASYYFQITPRVPVTLLFWNGDEDFPPEAKIMYDKSIIDLLSLDIVFALAVAICVRVEKPRYKTETPIISSSEELDIYVGQEITIKGHVSNTKTASILNIDVESCTPDLRDQVAKATGILHRDIITDEMLQSEMEKIGIFANRGPGVFYSLRQSGSELLAHVQAVETPEND